MNNGYESGESTHDTTIAQPQEGDCWRVNSEDDTCQEYIEDTSHEH